VAPLICYDATVPWLARDAARDGAELIVTLSNDSWFARGGGPRLHFAVSGFRSLETRRAQIRVTNTGISAGILPSGELVALAGVHERTALVATLPVFRARTTLAVAWGDWLGPLSAGLAVLGLVLPVSGSTRSRTPPARGAGRRDRRPGATR
jgi:apolipoprotein N-acyltransferase